MAAPAHVKTYTLTDLQVAPYDAAGVYAALDLIDVPGIQSATVTVTNDAAELRGDNRIISVVDQGNSLEWSMAAGGISMDALVAIFGGTLTDDGVAPNATRRWRVLDTDQRPYFAFVGVTPDDGAGGGLHVVVHKAKATGNLELTAADQEFMAPSFSGRGLGRDLDGALFDLMQHETLPATTALPTEV